MSGLPNVRKTAQIAHHMSKETGQLLARKDPACGADATGYRGTDIHFLHNLLPDSNRPLRDAEGRRKQLHWDV